MGPQSARMTMLLKMLLTGKSADQPYLTATAQPTIALAAHMESMCHLMHWPLISPWPSLLDLYVFMCQSQIIASQLVTALQAQKVDGRLSDTLRSWAC